MSEQQEAKSLKEKVFDIKSQIGKISKDSTNPFFNNAKYYDINALLENLQVYLEANRILLTQPLIDDRVYTIIEDLDSGETMKSSLKLPDLDNPQKIGSCVTYYRRYTCASLFALQAEDDDANLASTKKTPSKSASNTEQKQGNKKNNDDLPWLNEGTPQFNNALKAVSEGKTVKEIREHYKISNKVAELLN